MTLHTTHIQMTSWNIYRTVGLKKRSKDWWNKRERNIYIYIFFFLDKQNITHTHTHSLYIYIFHRPISIKIEIVNKTKFVEVRFTRKYYFSVSTSMFNYMCYLAFSLRNCFYTILFHSIFLQRHWLSDYFTSCLSIILNTLFFSPLSKCKAIKYN